MRRRMLLENNGDPYAGHDYVDLGLPSGTLWATMNVGATSEADYGNYYMYGKGSKTYDELDYRYGANDNKFLLLIFFFTFIIIIKVIVFFCET